MKAIVIRVLVPCAAVASGMFSVVGSAEIQDPASRTAEAPAAAVVTRHPWCPPFGLQRIGQPGGTADFEADAIARPAKVINPVDAGTILVPADWLLLVGGRGGTIEVAAMNRGDDIPDASVVGWFESTPTERISTSIKLLKNRRGHVTVRLPASPKSRDRDVLHVAIVRGDGTELWRKKIRTMLVHSPPEWPKFGATETKLRYDAPISILAEDGTLSSLEYDKGWNPKLKDVVVSLPSGARFVFWRGSSYIPFWAGRHNTGFCYEWAETTPPEGFVDAVEPLMDKELRYGRVEIVESTSARIHVRWSYQSCDFNYKTWGDSAVEDFYFYPDGFGTRVLTLKSDPAKAYEVSEFIILSAQGTYPLRVLPENLVDVLFLDGVKRRWRFPFDHRSEAKILKTRNIPAIYRIRLHKEERQAAVYFSPWDPHPVSIKYGPFYDKGCLVTPVYWGSHWPLARGKTTGGSIDDRIHATPAHNSIATWGYRHRPEALEDTTVDTTDTLGQARRMRVQRWAWLIGMTRASDERLLARARSYARPPAVTVRGGQRAAYLPERRAHRLPVRRASLAVDVKPSVPCICPVFELVDAPKKLARVAVNDRRLVPRDYAWDGETLWLNIEVVKPTTVHLTFSGTEGAETRSTAGAYPVTPPGPGPGIGAAERILPPTLRNTAEFRFDLGKAYENPCDPDQIAVDALVTGPDQRSVTVPAFWREPYTHKVETRPLDLSAIRLLRFFITARDDCFEDHFKWSE